MPGDGYGFLLLVGQLDFCGISVQVEVGAYGEPCCGCGVGDEADNGLVAFQWSSSPVAGYPGEEPVLDLVPFAGAGRIVADGDVESGAAVRETSSCFQSQG